MENDNFFGDVQSNSNSYVSITESGTYNLAIEDVAKKMAKSFNDPEIMEERYNFKFRILNGEQEGKIMFYETSKSWTEGWDAYTTKDGEEKEAGSPSKLFAFVSGAFGIRKLSEFQALGRNGVIGKEFTVDIDVTEKEDPSNVAAVRYTYKFNNFRPLEKSFNEEMKEESTEKQERPF